MPSILYSGHSPQESKWCPSWSAEKKYLTDGCQSCKIDLKIVTCCRAICWAILHACVRVHDVGKINSNYPQRLSGIYLICTNNRTKVKNHDTDALTVGANIPHDGKHTHTETSIRAKSALSHSFSCNVCTFLILTGGAFLFIHQCGWKLTCSKHTTMGFPAVWSLYVLYAWSTALSPKCLATPL